VNYRLGIFGFFSHPELTTKSGRNASGNYGLLDQAEVALKVCSASTDAEAARSAADLFSDQFIVYSTWRWVEMQVKNGQISVCRFQFDRVTSDDKGVKSFGAVHAVEIEYALNTLDPKKANWQPEDRKTALTMANYWANFIKTSNPNGLGLPKWPEFGKSRQVMHLDGASLAQPEQHRDRYEFLDSIHSK
jgi:para-nitrobenzyl esterase